MFHLRIKRSIIDVTVAPVPVPSSPPHCLFQAGTGFLRAPLSPLTSDGLAELGNSLQSPEVSPHLLRLPRQPTTAPMCTVTRVPPDLELSTNFLPPSLLLTTHVASRSGALCVQITPALEERLLIKKNVTAPEMIIQLFYNCAAEAITNVNECH